MCADVLAQGASMDDVGCGDGDDSDVDAACKWCVSGWGDVIAVAGAETPEVKE